MVTYVRTASYTCLQLRIATYTLTNTYSHSHTHTHSHSHTPLSHSYIHIHTHTSVRTAYICLIHTHACSHRPTRAHKQTGGLETEKNGTHLQILADQVKVHQTVVIKVTIDHLAGRVQIVVQRDNQRVGDHFTDLLCQRTLATATRAAQAHDGQPRRVLFPQQLEGFHYQVETFVEGLQ
jgi:hypothetical protein